MPEKPTGLELILGPAGEYYFFKTEILERMTRTSPLEYDFLYFLPVKRAVRYFKEQLIAAAPRRILPDPPIFTFYDFMTAFYRQIPGARKIISAPMRLFLVEEVLKAQAERLRFFSEHSAQRRGLVKKVEATLQELREYGYSSEELLEAVEQGDSRYHDFALLIDCFEKVLGDRLIDEAGAIQQCLASLTPQSWQEYFPQVETIYLNGYGLYTRPMLEFIARLKELCRIRIKLDYLPGQSEGAFEHIDPAYQALMKLKPEVSYSREPREWETHLFRHPEQQTPETHPGKDLLIQALNNRRDEVAFIANYVKRLHVHQGIPLHEIGITFPSLEQYAPLIHEIFPRYGLPDNGLPYNLSTGFQLSQSPLIRSFLLLLEAPLSQFDFKKLTQLVSSPFFQPAPEYDLTAAQIKLLSRELRTPHLTPTWETDLQKHIDALQYYLEESKDDDFDREESEKTVEKLRALQGPLSNFYEKLQELESPCPINEFRERYLGLLTLCGFLDWYRDENTRLGPQERQQEYRAFNRFNKLLDQFCWIVANLHGERALSLKELFDYLSLLVSQATYNVREWSRYGLQIMPRLEILSTQPRVLIFGGMIEGEFPRPYTRDVFFHDEEREEMGLAATEDLLAQDKFLFYQVLSCPAERLVFTYPRFRKEAAQVPSNFLTVLSDALKLRWREHISARFLANAAQQVESVGQALAGGLAPGQQGILANWLTLHRSDPEKRETAAAWLQRVRQEHRKRRSPDFGPQEGMLGDYPEIVEHLHNSFANRSFSITRLEKYAFCPMQFFLRHLIKIEEEPQLETGLTALERGQMVHQTLFRFYSKLREINALETPWLHRKLLHDIAREEFNRLPFSGVFFDLEKERYFGGEDFLGLWDIFLDEEQAQITTLQFYPRFFEVAFGRAGRKSEQDPVSQPEPIVFRKGSRQFKISGKIDRIDVNPDGQAMILDYKTGSSFSKTKAVADGLSLQLPVYLRALENLAQTHPEMGITRPVFAGIYQIRDSENCGRVPVMFDKYAGLPISTRLSAALPYAHYKDEAGQPFTFNGLLDVTESRLFDLYDSLCAGNFRHTRYPDRPGCQNYCPFRRTCRKDLRKLLGNREADIPEDE